MAGTGAGDSGVTKEQQVWVIDLEMVVVTSLSKCPSN